MSARNKKFERERGALNSSSTENLTSKKLNSSKASRPSSADFTKYSARSNASLVSLVSFMFPGPWTHTSCHELRLNLMSKFCVVHSRDCTLNLDYNTKFDVMNFFPSVRVHWCMYAMFLRTICAGDLVYWKVVGSFKGVVNQNEERRAGPSCSKADQR